MPGACFRRARGHVAGNAKPKWRVGLAGSRGFWMSTPVLAFEFFDSARPAGFVLPVHVPGKVEPANLPSMVAAIEKALAVMADAGVQDRADHLAALATGFVESSLELVQERGHRMCTSTRFLPR